MWPCVTEQASHRDSKSNGTVCSRLHAIYILLSATAKGKELPCTYTGAGMKQLYFFIAKVDIVVVL